MLAGAIPAMIFPFAGLATSFLNLAYAQDYYMCELFQSLADTHYTDHLRSVMRSYSCWYYGYTISKLNRNNLMCSLLHIDVQTV